MSAPDLFSQPPMELAIKQRDTAILLQAAANGEEFGRRSREFILQHLKDNGPTSGEALVIACKNAGIVPMKDDRSFGGSFLSLSKRGLIKKVGEVKRSRGHATAGGILWSFTNPIEAAYKNENLGMPHTDNL